METFNTALFLLINAPDDPNVVMLMAAKSFAEYVIWLVPVVLVVGWLRGGQRTRKLMLQATVAGLGGLLINQVIGWVWQHPRPFMIGLGHTFLHHAADSSFPSDHLTLLWAVSVSFLMHQRLRLAGALLTTLGLPMAWARIYLGVHFPLDMVGAAMVAGVSAWLCFCSERWWAGPVFQWASTLYRHIFAPLIRRGWVLK